MHNAAVIGAGNLGRRHMESLLKSPLLSQITIIDSSRQSLDAAKRAASNDVRASFHENIDALPNELDFVVVATSSLPRRDIVEQLLSRSHVRYLLLEKVLFPRVNDYGNVSRLLGEHDTKTWVNCARRIMPFYQSLRETLTNAEGIYVTISGGSWGMACNIVHLLDLIAYLSGRSDGFSIDTSRLDHGFISAKREGYIEFTGLLTGSSAGCSHFTIECAREHAAPMTTTIQTGNTIITLYEHAKTAFVAKRENNWAIETIHFEIPYQSQLTGSLFEELIQTGDCALTTYEESVKIHVPMLEAFIRHYADATGQEEQQCPIT